LPGNANTLIETREQQQVVDQRAHADRFLLGAPHRFAQLVPVLESTAEGYA